MKISQFFMLTFIFIYSMQIMLAKPAKIVGLMVARNEENIIDQALKALSCFTDAIVFLDDASTDNTLAIAESLEKKCNIEKVLKNTTWVNWNETENRNKQLTAARSIGGTHFMIIDADEIISSACMNNNYLRQQILALKPGEKLAFYWIQLWRSTEQWRVDRTIPKIVTWCDDGISLYSDDAIHGSMTPPGIDGNVYLLPGGSTYGLIHLPYVNWNNVLEKQSWYRCYEFINYKHKTVQDINARYAPSKDEKNMQLTPIVNEWFSGYSFYDPTAYKKPIPWRKKQVLEWFDQYGKDYFADLDIWDVNWEKFN